MSAVGFTPIQLFRTTTASAVPSAGSLAAGELAINLTDEALYFKNAAGVVTLLADSSGSLGSVTSVNASGGTTGLTFSGGPITTSGTLTLGGTLAVANGGTGVTTSTGTGSVVLNTSPTLVTPALGVASADSIATLKGTVGNVAYGFISDTNTGMWSPSSDAIAFSTAGSERLRVTSGGDVLVGAVTQSFSSKTEITSGSANLLALYNTVSNGGAKLWLLDGNSSAAIGNVGPNLLFYTAGNSSERMRIDGSGNVGIGTSSPSQRLDVNGNINVSGTGQFTNATYCQIGATSGAVQGQFAANASGSVDLRAVSNHPVLLYTNNTERMRIDASGNVGIGTSSPVTRLQVSAASGYNEIRVSSGANSLGLAIDGSAAYLAAFQSMPLTFQTNSVERMRIDGSGNVGIGTSLPGQTLQVVNAGSYQFRLGAGSTFNYDLGRSASDGLLYFYGNQSTFTGYVFGGVDGERMRIDSSGNVGIGTGSPSSLLHVNGTVNFSGALTSGNLADAVGYKGLPANVQGSGYTLVLDDQGKMVTITGGVTIPANGSVAFPVGTTVVIYNNSASNQTISITTDTLRLAGTATTGARTLAQRGFATCIKVAATEWVVTGNVT